MNLQVMFFSILFVEFYSLEYEGFIASGGQFVANVVSLDFPVPFRSFGRLPKYF